MISYYIDTKSWSYQQNCLLNPIQSSAFATILFSAIDVFQGAPMERVLRPRSLGTYFGGIYLYHALQCPMEAFHGRPSLWHNVISGGSIGLMGVASGRLSIPFIGNNAQQIYYKTGLTPPLLAFGVYGTLSGILAGVLGNKRF